MSMQETYQKQSKAKLIAACTAIILVVGLVLVIDHLKSSQKASVAATTANDTSTSTAKTTTPATQSTEDSSNTSPTTSSIYKDGTYSASSEYFVPHGYENIKVTLTVQDGTVTDSSIVNSEGDPDSESFQEAFESAYKSQVVGKKLSDIHLSFVAGASDTAEGFNDAVSQIETKAQA